MTANRKIVVPFKVKVIMKNDTTKIESVTDTLANVQEVYDAKLNEEIVNYEVYASIRGSYQLIHEGVEEYNM